MKKIAFAGTDGRTLLWAFVTSTATSEIHPQNYNGVVEQWKKNCDQLGKIIDVKLKNRNEEAFFEDISSEGHLIYRLHSGKVGKLVSGDVIAY